MKQCTKCKVLKPLDKFSKKSSSSDGLNYHCKDCERLQKQAYYLANKEAIRKKNLAYELSPKGKTRRKEFDERYREENKSKLKEKARKYYELNKNAINALALAYKKSPRGKEATKLSSSAYTHTKRATSDGTITADSLRILRESQNDRCAYCSTYFVLLPERLIHLDHVIPLSKGGIHSMKNVVWSCARCNLTKAATIQNSSVT